MINTIDGFYIGNSVPIDSRIVASSSNVMNAIIYKYDGLRIYRTDVRQGYTWNAGSATWSSDNILSGSGTTNYIPQWSGVSGLTNSIISISGSNVGVNISTYHLQGTFQMDSASSDPFMINQGSTTILGYNWYYTTQDQIFNGSHGQSTMEFDNTGSINFRVNNGSGFNSIFKLSSSGYTVVGSTLSVNSINSTGDLYVLNSANIHGGLAIGNTISSVSNNNLGVQYQISVGTSSVPSYNSINNSNVTPNESIYLTTKSYTDVLILNNPSSTLYYGGSNGFNTSTQNLSMVIGVNANYSQSLLFSDNYKNTGLNIQSIGSSGYASYSTVTHHGPIIFNHINNLYGSTNSITNSGAVVIYAATSSDSSYNHLVLTDYQSGTNSNASFAWGNIKYRYAGSTDYPEFKFEFTPEGNNGSPDWYFKLISGQTGIYTSSDERLKENIKELDDSLDKILKLNPVFYNVKKSHIKTQGFIAQEVKEVFPGLVSGGENEYYCMSVDGMIPYLVKAIQELSQEIKILKKD